VRAWRWLKNPKKVRELVSSLIFGLTWVSLQG
jgi:hypothetical protein